MPLYEYRCPKCGPFTASRRMAERNAPADCPDCSTSATRMISAPRLALLDAARRHAHATNERSSHSPRVEKNHVHSSNCGCGKPSQAANPGGVRTRTGHRPWMISH
ncbi:FmdB family zinc ribbon protein [Salinisphaera sp. RV14]|uniref:FmdB family zinc ribbon protein n=1 Tax=unclassified Salinisphaera TaxID=2649847 RepID=UPI003F855F6C